MKFKESLPLYPPEAYSEQNNPSAFMRQEGTNQNENANKQSPFGNNSALMPLLLKFLLGGANSSVLSQEALNSIAGANSNANPLMSILSSMTNVTNKKNSSEPESPKEKSFPEN